MPLLRTTGRSVVLLVTGVLLTFATGCGENSTAGPSIIDEAALPVPTDPVLALGQAVYRGDCTNCHTAGKKGAPRFGDATAWAPRLSQGLATLTRHAIEGYYGPAGDEMPARGGNDELTDEQVAAAVRYQVEHAR
jgi:cytochrome c5